MNLIKVEVSVWVCLRIPDSYSLPNDYEEVSAKFLYTTGVATWSSRMGNHRFFDYGLDKRADSHADTLRVLEFPVGEYEAQSFRDTLAALLNDGGFAGTIPEGSGTTYLVEGTGTEVRELLLELGEP